MDWPMAMQVVLAMIKQKTTGTNVSICLFAFPPEMNKMNFDSIRLLYDVWDTARIVDTEETYEQRVHFFHLSMQILKVITYIVLSLVVLAAAVAGKGSLLLMTTAVGNSTSVSVLFD